MPEEILVACAGNRLVGDDGAGPAVFDLLSAVPPPPEVRLEEIGCAGIGLLDYLAGQRLLVVVDAVCFGAAPGTVHVHEWNALPRSNRAAVSGHGVHLWETIEIGRRLEPARIPEAVLLVGIEGASFDRLGAGLSARVEPAVPHAARIVRSLIHLALKPGLRPEVARA